MKLSTKDSAVALSNASPTDPIDYTQTLDDHGVLGSILSVAYMHLVGYIEQRSGYNRVRFPARICGVEKLPERRVAQANHVEVESVLAHEVRKLQDRPHAPILDGPKFEPNGLRD